MARRSISRHDVAALLVVLTLWLGSAGAGGPRSVNGLGQPMRWDTGAPVSYHPDQGPLGRLSNAEARALLAEAFAVWAAGPAEIEFDEANLLPHDVDAAANPLTNPAHYRSFYRVDGDNLSPVIFDADGAIMDSYLGLGARFDILGIAGVDTPVGLLTEIEEASLILNGAFFDGLGPPESPEDVTLQGLKAMMVHEIGHFINLDHSVLNHELALDGNPGNDVYVPTMFPVTVSDESALATTNADDELAALNLYPGGAPAGAIEGGISFQGATFQGANVVLRRIGDELVTAYSLISGGRYAPCNPGSTCDPCRTSCDPGNPSARGAFGAAHLAPGQYRVCVEQIDTRFSLAGGSFVGPLATPALLPGPEECFDAEESGDHADDPDDFDGVSPGTLDVDFHLNPLPGTPCTSGGCVAVPEADMFEPNQTPAAASTLADLPAGRDTAPAELPAGDVDAYAVPVVAGQQIRIDIEAAELGSTLDAVVGFYDASNALVALVDDALDLDSRGFSFDPALELTAGFTGTGKVVVSSFPDMDQDGSDGATTGAYWIRVEVATDTDGDGAADGVDVCPATARDDADRDGLCFGSDDCPTYANPLQIELTKLNGVLVPGGDVATGPEGHRLSPDGSRVVYRADQDVDGSFELYSVPVGGGTATKLNGPLVAGGGVFTFHLSPDSSRVVYLGDQDTDNAFEVYSVPIGGGTSTKLNGPLVAGGRVFGMLLAPDGSRVVYSADQDTDEVVELYSVPIGGGTPTKLSPALVAGGDVSFVQGSWAIAPDSSRVVYSADRDTDNIVELYSVPLAGGASIKLNGPILSGGAVVGLVLVSSDSSTVVYRADQDTLDVDELYSVPLGGGPAIKLNGPLVPGGDVAFDFLFSPDSTRVVYSADQETDNVLELYSVPIAGGTPIRLNGPLVAGGDINPPWLVSPDSATVVFNVDQDIDQAFEVYSVPIVGGTPIKLNEPLVAGDIASRISLAAAGSRVVYLTGTVAVNAYELYSVPIGGGTPTRLSGPLVAGGSVSFAAGAIVISPDGSHVVYQADQDTDEVLELYRVPVAGGSPIKLSGPLVTGGDLDLATVSADGSRVVYRADQDVDSVLELYSVDALAGSDSDADGVLNLCDLCPAAADPDQDDVDGNGVGDACAGCAPGTDPDADLVCNPTDNCPTVPNPGQADFDGDDVGDGCDADDDGDGLADGDESDTGTDPLDADSDDDGVQDGAELVSGTDPNDPDETGSPAPFHPGRTIRSVESPYTVHAADVDGDGDTDVLSASYSGNTIEWYDNDGASPPGWTQRSVGSTGIYHPTSVAAADVDGDGDLDAVVAANAVFWFESNGASPPAWNVRTIDGTVTGSRSACAADVDGDGDVDALSASANLILLHESDGGSPPSWTKHTISDNGVSAAYSVFAADVDGDGDLDALSASYFDDTVAWYENDGAIPPWTKRSVKTSAGDAPESVFATDVDADGDVDVLSAWGAGDRIAWHENSGAAPPIWTEHILTATADGALAVVATDMDGDGDADVLSAAYEDYEIAWYENDGADPPGWTSRTIGLAPGARGVFVADVDGDGDPDALSASENDDEVVWYENRTIHRNAAFAPESTIDTTADGAASVFAADVDGDGDVDALSAGYEGNTIAWYENDGASPPGWTEHTVSSVGVGPWSVFAADVDGDGDLDALSALGDDQTIAWYENDGMQPPSWTQRIVSSDANGPRSVFAADLDGDGDLDTLSASNGLILWYESDGMSPPGWTRRILFSAPSVAYSVFAADVDGDGDTDALSASQGDSTIAWYDNDGASPPGWTKRIITNLAVGAACVFAADVNGDGDLDVLSASAEDNTVAWYENNGVSPPGWSRHPITTSAGGAVAVFAADVDADGDVDVLSAAQADGTIAWHENDGASPPGWTSRTLTTGASAARSVFAADADGDGDLDALSASQADDTIAWYENRGGQFTLDTTVLAPASMADGSAAAVLAIELTGNGRASDGEIELATLELLVTDAAGAPLSSDEANALLERVRVWLDSGSAAFEPESDTLVTTVETLQLAPLVVEFEAGDPRVRVGPGQSRTFFLVVSTMPDTSAQGAGGFRVVHLGGSSSKARDVATGLLVEMEYRPATSTATIGVVPDTIRPIVTGTFPSSGTLDVALSSNVVLYFSEPVDPASAAPGISLSAGGIKVAAEVSISDDGSVLSLDPESMLSAGADYVVRVTMVLTDRSGNPAVPFSATFDTAATASGGSIGAGDLGGSAGGATLGGEDAEDNSGTATAALGDVDGDGIADLIVGAPNAGAGDAGKARLIFGSPALQSDAGPVTALAYETGMAGDQIGETVARAGDLGGDERQDILIGAPHADVGGADAGVVYLVFGDPGLDDVAPSTLDLDDLTACSAPTHCGVRFVGEQPGDLAGSSLSWAGDVNGDGADDLLIGAPGASPGGKPAAGKAYLIYGPLGPVSIDLGTVGSTTPGLVFHGEAAGDRLGSAVSAWEDDSSDGIDDLLLGAPGATPLDELGTPLAEAGYVYAIQGGTGPGKLDDTATPGVIELGRVASGAADQVAGMVFLGARSNGHLGRSMTGAADIDDDGVKDVLFAGDGVAFAIPGDGPKTVSGNSRTGGNQTVTQGLARAPGELDALLTFGGVLYEASDDGPSNVGAAGDVNHDGYGDFVIGAPLADGLAGDDAGQAYLILGGPAHGGEERLLADVGQTIAGFVVEGAASGDHLGASVGGGFDLNADGVDDGLVGAPFADTAVTQEDAGETYVISPVRPDEALQLLLERVAGGTRLEWRIPDLAAVYNVYRGLLSTLRAAGAARTSDMTQLACGIATDADADDLPDTDDAELPPPGEAFLYLVTAENLQGEGPLGPPAGEPPRDNDAQCP